jgi:hypothetical protein
MEMFVNLELAMAERRIKSIDLVPILKMSPTQVSLRLRGRVPFAPHEKTRISEFLHLNAAWLFQPGVIPASARSDASIKETGGQLPMDESRPLTDEELSTLGLELIEQANRLIALRQAHPPGDPMRAEIEQAIIRWQATQQKLLKLLESHRKSTNGQARVPD